MALNRFEKRIAQSRQTAAEMHRKGISSSPGQFRSKAAWTSIRYALVRRLIPAFFAFLPMYSAAASPKANLALDASIGLRVL